jgi:hypothetical protein
VLVSFKTKKALASEVLKRTKNTRENKQKNKQKDVKFLLFIPYLDNIETTSIEIFAETTINMVKSGNFLLNRLLSGFHSSLIYGRIWSYFFFGVKNSREGFLLKEFFSKTYKEYVVIELVILTIKE